MTNDKIFQCASKWYARYADRLSTDAVLSDGFDADWQAAGALMDQGAAFDKLYGHRDNFADVVKLGVLMQQVTDVQALANAILSYWTQLNVWHTEALTQADVRAAMTITMRRLLELTDPRGQRQHPEFVVARLSVDNGSALFMGAGAVSLSLQELTITSAGFVRLRATTDATDDQDAVRLPVRTTMIDSNAATAIVRTMAAVESDPPDHDVDNWALTVSIDGVLGTTKHGTDTHMDDDLEKLSVLIRALTDWADLRLFDGQTGSKLNRFELLVESTGGPTLRNAVVIRRDQGTIDFDLELPGHNEHVHLGDQNDVNLALGQINLVDFGRSLSQSVISDRDDVDSTTYAPSVRFVVRVATDGGETVRQGLYYRPDLPNEWARVVAALTQALGHHYDGPIMMANCYAHGALPDELVYCHVTFGQDGQMYSYIADTDNYFVGERVVVPVGADDAEREVTIKAIDYCYAEDAPWPVTKTKHIIRPVEADAL